MKRKLILSTLVSSLFIVFAHNAGANSETDDPARPTLGQTGKIFTLRFDPAKKQLTVGLTGQTVAEVGPERIVVLGTQYPTGSNKGRPLSISPNQNRFEILDVIDNNSVLEIEVQDRTSNKKEIFKVEQKSRP